MASASYGCLSLVIPAYREEKGIGQAIIEAEEADNPASFATSASVGRRLASGIYPHNRVRNVVLERSIRGPDCITLWNCYRAPLL
jgi:hypothetical protein